MKTVDEVDYGPLTALIGTWQGDKGFDVAPDPDGIEENPYYETITYEAIGGVTNADEQTNVALRYLQVVKRKSDDKVFHDQTGYWIWHAPSNTITHSFTIPRAVCVIAGGNYDAASQQGESVKVSVASKIDTEWGITQSPFMAQKAKTTSYEHTFECDGKTLRYEQTTIVDIFNRTIEHTDKNELNKIS